jgi:hypothetical protein
MGVRYQKGELTRMGGDFAIEQEWWAGQFVW